MSSPANLPLGNVLRHCKTQTHSVETMQIPLDVWNPVILLTHHLKQNVLGQKCATGDTTMDLDFAVAHIEAVIWKTVSVSRKLSTFSDLSFYEKENAVKAGKDSDETELLLFQWGFGTNEVQKNYHTFIFARDRFATQPLM